LATDGEDLAICSPTVGAMGVSSSKLNMLRSPSYLALPVRHFLLMESLLVL